MTFYSIALFLHITGALGLFVMLGLEWISLLYLRRVSAVEPVREWLKAIRLLRWLAPASMVTILLSGFYMMHTAWGGAAWIIIALVAMVLQIPLAVINGRRMAVIGRAILTEGEALSPDLRQRLHDPLLWTFIQIRTGVTLGIVFLMTVKPALAESLLVMVAAAVLGLLSAWPLWQRGQTNYQEYHHEV